MFNPKNFIKTDPSDLEKEIARLHSVLEGMAPDDPKYATVAEQYNKLYRLKEVDNNSKRRVSADALLTFAGSLIGILAILNKERFDIVNSKALGFIMKSR